MSRPAPPQEPRPQAGYNPFRTKQRVPDLPPTMSPLQPLPPIPPPPNYNEANEAAAPVLPPPYEPRRPRYPQEIGDSSEKTLIPQSWLAFTRLAPMPWTPTMDIREYLRDGEFALVVHSDKITSNEDVSSFLDLIKRVKAREALYTLEYVYIKGNASPAKVELFKGGSAVTSRTFNNSIPNLRELRAEMIPSMPHVLEHTVVWSTLGIQEKLIDASAVFPLKTKFPRADEYDKARAVVVVVYFYDAHLLDELARTLDEAIDSMPPNKNRRPPIVVFVDLHEKRHRDEVTNRESWLRVLPSIQIFRADRSTVQKNVNADLVVVERGAFQQFTKDHIKDVMFNERENDTTVVNARGDYVIGSKFPLLINRALPLMTIDESSEALKYTGSVRDTHVGSFGWVEPAIYIDTPVVVKKMRLANMMAGYGDLPDKGKEQLHEQEAEALNEANKMALLRHPNIVLFMGVHFQEAVKPVPSALSRMEISLVLERMDYDLDRWMFSRDEITARSVSYKRRVKGMIDFARGLAFLHHQGYIHGNLKPANLLFQERSGVVKIGDFGHCRLFDALNSKQKPQGSGTYGYDAPEVLRVRFAPQFSAAEVAASVETPGVDMFAFGVILLEMLTGTDMEEMRKRMPIEQRSSPFQLMYQTLTNLANNESPRAAYWYATSLVDETSKLLLNTPALSIGAKLSPRMFELISGCLVTKPSLRWNAHQALQALQAELQAVEISPFQIPVPRPDKPGSPREAPPPIPLPPRQPRPDNARAPRRVVAQEQDNENFQI